MSRLHNALWIAVQRAFTLGGLMTGQSVSESVEQFGYSWSHERLLRRGTTLNSVTIPRKAADDSSSIRLVRDIQ